jgi:hypothetical protein
MLEYDTLVERVQLERYQGTVGAMYEGTVHITVLKTLNMYHYFVYKFWPLGYDCFSE